MSLRNLTIAVLAVGLVALAGSGFGNSQASLPDKTPYNPRIDPVDFSATISNKYFRLQPGTKFTYVKKGSAERVEIEVTSETRLVMDVTARMIRVRERINDVLKDETRDWYAQDKAGNVWYFGKNVDSYKNGKVVSHEGTWAAGVAGARPGIIMLAAPKVGDTYRQEYFKGVAENMGTIVALNEKVVVPHGSYEGCLKVRDWSRIDKTVNDHKYYCPMVGFLVAEHPVGQPSERTELVHVKTD